MLSSFAVVLPPHRHPLSVTPGVGAVTSMSDAGLPMPRPNVHIDSPAMGGLKKIPSEGGSGGRRGHSGMEHWAETSEIKVAARGIRRRQNRQMVIEGLADLDDAAIDDKTSTRSPDEHASVED
jgi:hypothetical protein